MCPQFDWWYMAYHYSFVYHYSFAYHYSWLVSNRPHAHGKLGHVPAGQLSSHVPMRNFASHEKLSRPRACGRPPAQRKIRQATYLREIKLEKLSRPRACLPIRKSRQAYAYETEASHMLTRNLAGCMPVRNLAGPLPARKFRGPHACLEEKKKNEM